jgi:hypothetical protein
MNVAVLATASIETLRNLPVSIFDDETGIAEWDTTPIARASDSALIALVAHTIAAPKTSDHPNSFVLHAPLELLARIALLPMVETQARSAARRRIVSIAMRYAHAGDEVTFERISFESVESARQALIDAFAVGDQALAHNALSDLIARLPAHSLRSMLVDRIAPMQGAAAHAPILLAELARCAGRIDEASALLLAPLHYVLLHHQSRLDWFENKIHENNATDVEGAANSLLALMKILSCPPAIDASSTSISAQIGAANEALRGDTAFANLLQQATLDGAEKLLLRTAVHSMLQDDPKHAPYGWTHCLTLPLALLTNMDASRAPRTLATLAATHVYAYRATMGRTSLDFAWKPEPPVHRELIAATPSQAASIAFHAQPDDQSELRIELATFAATHRDAHLAKYTLACFDASARDPECASLYLAAAAYLGAWWREFDTRR